MKFALDFGVVEGGVNIFQGSNCLSIDLIDYLMSKRIEMCIDGIRQDSGEDNDLRFVFVDFFIAEIVKEITDLKIGNLVSTHETFDQQVERPARRISQIVGRGHIGSRELDRGGSGQARRPYIHALIVAQDGQLYVIAYIFTLDNFVHIDAGAVDADIAITGDWMPIDSNDNVRRFELRHLPNRRYLRN